MRTIGLIGGMSWESTETYYRLLNEGVRDRLGGLHSAKIAMYSIDFAELEPLQRNDWDAAGDLLVDAARRVETAGADLLLIGANTMHRCAPEVEAAVEIPLVHIVDATAARIVAAGLTRVGLLGTRYTMEHEFFRDRLARRYGITALIPEEPERTKLHDVIYEELAIGRFEDESRELYRRAIAALEDRGAEGVIYGCTEISLLVGPDDARTPVFDTVQIHAERAVDLALEGVAARAA
jgi:aspartate racemase